MSTRTKVLSLLVVLALGLAYGAAGNAATVVYVGTWNNLTFGSSGPARFEIATLGDDFGVTMDLDGNVFGGANPDPITLMGTLDSMTGIGAFSFNDHPVFGDVTGTISGGTAVNANAVDIPVFGISGATANGSITADSIALDYEVFFAPVFGGGSAVGTIEALRVIPIPAALPLLGSVLALLGYRCGRRRPG